MEEDFSNKGAITPWRFESHTSVKKKKKTILMTFLSLCKRCQPSISEVCLSIRRNDTNTESTAGVTFFSLLQVSETSVTVNPTLKSHV